MQSRLLSAATFAVLSFFASQSAAQEATPSDGLRPPDASVGTVGDALALEVNPAGLGFMSRPELGYGFELASEDLRGVANEAHGFFLAGGTGWLGAGLAAQWLQKPDLGGDLQSYRKFTFGTAAAFSRLGVGIALNYFGSSDDERLDGLVGLDIGFQLRASRTLGLGLVIRDANGPFIRENRSLPTRLHASAALRFWDGRVVVEQGVTTNLRDRYVRLVPRLSVEALTGVRIFGSSDFLFARVGDTFRWDWEYLTAGLELSLGSIGASYAASFGDYPPGDELQFSSISSYHWVSPGKRPALFPLTKRWIYVNLNTSISEEPQRGFFQPKSRSFLSVARELERISEADDVDGIVINIASGLGYAQTWELRELVKRVQASGKKTIAILPSSSLRAYYLASSADEIWYVPTDTFGPMGLRSRFISISEAFSKIGVEAQFVRVGAYKSAPEMFVKDEATKENIEQRQRYLDAFWKQLLGDIAAGRRKSSAEMEALITKTHMPHEAMKAGLIDKIVYPDEVDVLLRKEHQASLERGYPEANPIDTEWPGGPEIAVVAIDGDIVQGESTGSIPLLGQRAAGARSIQRTLERLRTDGNVRAVVIRVDSPGGSAVASDLIYRSIRRLAAVKPVVASLGNMATSGGYYVAAGADEILAGPTTLTGSVGIFAGKVHATQLAARIGVNTSAIQHGQPSTFTDVFTPWNEQELANVGTSLNYMYRLFLTQVAQTRPLTVEEVDKVARGRMWAGAASIEAKLVDGEGGVIAALHRAEELSGLESGDAKYKLYVNGGSRVGLDVDLQASAAALLGLDEAHPVERLLTRNTMVGAALRDAAFAWRLPLLYGPGEALMLPEESLRLED